MHISDPRPLVHIIFSIITLGVLCTAGVQAVVLAFQDYHLRVRHGAGIIRRLPSLETMERRLFFIIWLGFLLLSIFLLTSIYFFHEHFTFYVVYKSVLAAAAWLVLGALLMGRHIAGWRGRKAIYGTLVGFGLLVLAYVSAYLYTFF